MRRLIVLFVTTTFLLLPLCFYMYGKGEMDGVEHYKHSKQFQLTLYSMYMFGARDGYDACKAGK